MRRKKLHISSFFFAVGYAVMINSNIHHVIMALLRLLYSFHTEVDLVDYESLMQAYYAFFCSSRL